jgi:hypothetical protein
MPDLLSTTHLQISFQKTIDTPEMEDYTFTTMIGTYRQQLSMREYIVRCVMIAVITFFFVSFIVFSLITIDKSHEIVDWFPVSYDQFEADFQEYLRLIREPLIIKYFRWLGDLFTGDWGYSLLGDSYYK